MRFLVSLYTTDTIIPINYQYPLSAAIYKILSKADKEYTNFLHESGYGKGFKLFSFSDIKAPFKIQSDRLIFLSNEIRFEIAFHLPVAAGSFVKGLFQSERIDIADKNSRAVFSIKSIESLPSPLQQYKENEVVNVQLKPLSPVVVGLRNQKGNYDFLSPDDAHYTESLIYNWRNKIATCYDDGTATAALLLMEVSPIKQPFKSRLITIKANTPEETRIRGWVNFGLKVQAKISNAVFYPDIG
jgi:Uncharacterized protein predicted to be involved in DNA repair (RAMP superfamily)